MVQGVRSRLVKGTLFVFATCTNTINEFQTWSFRRTPRGDPLPGDDKYEDRYNDALDVVKRIVATNSVFETQRAYIVAED